MPIRPIDMQVLLPKSQNISNMNQSTVNRSENIMQQAYSHNKKLDEKKLNKVNTLDKKQNPLIQNKSNKNSHRDSLKKKKRRKGKKDLKLDNKSNKIDIKV